MSRERSLNEADLDPDPLRQFTAWFEEAGAAGVRAPEAMALATAGADGRPSVRMVLLKGFDERGFVFFTGYESRKGAELTANSRAALLFYWDPLGRQVRIEGPVERVGGAESDAYFASRPRGSRLGALASPQSRVIPSRAVLEWAISSRAALIPFGGGTSVVGGVEGAVGEAYEAVVTIDLHRGHLDPAVATLPLPAERAAAVVAANRGFLERVRTHGVPIVHVITVLEFQ